mgnify:CR=1 FL=1
MLYEQASEAAEFVRSCAAAELDTALVLGSGLSAFADNLEHAIRIPYETIPHFARSTVEGHTGQLVIGMLEGRWIAVQQGRFHYYEGYDLGRVTFPIRMFGRLGVKNVILTNAAGSLNPEMRPGSFMLISDHLNCMGVNPLRGPNENRFGPRFPDMTAVYDKELQEIVISAAIKIVSENPDAEGFLHRGVYCALSGPTYETPAEIRMYRLLGADAVGMSTVPEAIVARHQGMRVIGISCITNFAAGMTGNSIDHDEVLQTGENVALLFNHLLRKTIKDIGVGK